MCNLRSTANPVICLHPLDFSEEKVDLIYIAAPGIPIRPLHRGARSTKRKTRGKVPNIEPHLFPVDDLVTQFVGDIFSLPPLKKLQPGTPNYICIRFIGMGFQMEEILAVPATFFSNRIT